MVNGYLTYNILQDQDVRLDQSMLVLGLPDLTRLSLKDGGGRTGSSVAPCASADTD